MITEELAARVDRFLYNLDPYEYADSAEDDMVTYIINNSEPILDYLWGVVRNEDDEWLSENSEEAKELIEMIKDEINEGR